MFCSKCGERLPEGAKFCGKCGQPIRGILEKQSQETKNQETKNLQQHDLQSRTPHSQGDQSRNSQVQNTGKSAKRGNAGILIGVMTFIVLAVVGLAAMLLKGLGKTETDGVNTVAGVSAGKENPDKEDSSREELLQNAENLIWLLSSQIVERSDDTQIYTYTYNVDGYRVERYGYLEGELYDSLTSEYDTEGNVLSSRNVVTDVTIQETSNEFDDMGNCVRRTMISYADDMSREDEKVRNEMYYIYDSNGALTGMEDSDNGIYTLEFNVDGTVKGYEWQVEGAAWIVNYEFQYEDGYIQSSEFTIKDRDGNIQNRQNTVYDGTGTQITNCGKAISTTVCREGEEPYTINYEYEQAVLTEEGIVLLGDIEATEKILAKEIRYWDEELREMLLYNAEGLPMREINYRGGSKYAHTDYEYDEKGLPIAEKYYTYEDDNLINWYEDYEYDDSGNVISKKWYTAESGGEAPEKIYTYEYDDKGLVLNKGEIQTDGSIRSLCYEYTYDQYGNKTGEHKYGLYACNVDCSVIKENGSHEYYYEYKNEYDDQNRLTVSYEWARLLDDKEVERTAYEEKIVYEYDADGDLLKESWYNKKEYCLCSIDYVYAYK